MKTNNIEICSILNGTANNYVVNTLINIFKDSMPPNILHSCPYFGRVEMENVSIDTTKIPSVFPSGSYRNRVLFFDDIDSNIFSATTFSTCKSSIKTSF